MWYLFVLSVPLIYHSDSTSGQKTRKRKGGTSNWADIIVCNTIEKASSNFRLSSTVFFIPQPVAVDGCTLELNCINGAGVAVIREIQDVTVRHRSVGQDHSCLCWCSFPNCYGGWTFKQTHATGCCCHLVINVSSCLSALAGHTKEKKCQKPFNA